MVKNCKKPGAFWENMSNPVTTGPEKRENQTHTEKSRYLFKQQGTLQALLLKKPEISRTQRSTTGVLSSYLFFCYEILNNSTGLLHGKCSQYTVHRYGRGKV